jgi:L-lactate dehydrogenase complex protein LldG
MCRLVEIFEKNALDAAAIVERCTYSPKAVHAAVGQAVRSACSIIVSAAEFLPIEIIDVLRELPGVAKEPNEASISNADVGITEAFAGVASTGSVCVSVGSGLNAVASLLMPLHIALLPVERIVERPRDLFDRSCFGGEGLRRDLAFITGPSATADMGPLVRGVHGPHRLHIFLLE